MARKKQMITLTLDPDLVERLKAWIARQRLPPAQNAVVALAIEEFLDRNEADTAKQPMSNER
jgi:predicted transcriptional regulator